MSTRRSTIQALVFALATTVAPPLPAQAFVRGDVDESASLDLTDGVRIVRYLFLGEADGLRCQDAADADDSGAIDLTDAIYLLNGLFRGGPAPPGPTGACGADESPDDLGCAAFGPCAGMIDLRGELAEAGTIVFAVETSQRVADDGSLATMAHAISTAVRALPRETRFGIVCFDSDVSKYPEGWVPTPATATNVEAAIAFLHDRQAGAGSCPHSGLASALQMAGNFPARRAIVYWGSGSGECTGADEGAYLRQALAETLARNILRIHVHAFGFRVPGPIQEGFLRDLAEETGGEYSPVGE